MGLIVEGQKCPVCGGYVFEEDDLVFCPVCGAPHHRDCYNSIGHCALESAHGTENQYKKPTPAPEKKEEPEEKKDNTAGYNAEIKQKCNGCSNLFDVNLKYCPHCGTPTQPVYTAFGSVVNFDPLGGVAKEEEIQGVKAGKLAQFIMVNTGRYLPKFKRMGNKNTSWNWAAFLLPQVWFFYRKMYLQGIFALIFTVIGELLAYPMVLALSQNGMTNAGYTEMASWMMNTASSDPTIYFMMMGGFLLALLLRIFCGMFGDRFYLNTAVSGIKSIEQEDGEEALLLRKKGGVNLILGFAVLMISNYLTPIIAGFIL